MTVENLEIKVKTPGVKAATNRLNSLADALNNVQSAAKDITGGSGSTSNGVKKVGTAAKEATKHTNNFASSLLRIAKYRLMRTVIKAITSAFSEGLKNAYAFSDAIVTEGHRFAQALDSMSSSGLKMKNQLGSALLSLLAALMPLLISVINLITRLADAMSQLFAAFTGGTYLKAIDVNKKWADTATKAGKAAKEWRNQLMGFDEINRLEEPSNGGGGGGGSDLDPTKMFEDTPLSNWAKKIQENLSLIELTASGFLLALGCILLFTGANIPLGLGLIVAGAYGFAKALNEDWSSVDPKVASAVAHVTAIVGGALLAVGALLTFTGANVPLGLALMTAGAVSLATSVAINWKAIKGSISSVLSEISYIVSGALLALGILITLATPSFSPLGLGLIIAGAVSLASAVALNWDEMPDNIRKVITTILIIVGTATFALGAILLFTGAAAPLGIGLMLAGAAALGTAVALNWDSLSDHIGSTVSRILTILGYALLVIGAALAFTGAALPLGIGLMIAGAGSLAAAAAVNWDSMTGDIKSTVSDILEFLGKALVVLGIILCLTGAGIPLGIGLIMAGAASMFASYAISTGSLIQAVQNVCDTIWGIVNGLFQAIHDWIQNLIDGINIFISKVDSRAQQIQDDGSVYLQGFASGGFPQEGQLFIANEAGPELVGTMGGQTAVAPQNDIVEGIRQGVYDAVVAANGSGNHDVSVKVYLDSKEIRYGQQRLARASGV